jgi:hypothetical protein
VYGGDHDHHDHDHLHLSILLFVRFDAILCNCYSMLVTSWFLVCLALSTGAPLRLGTLSYLIDFHPPD